MDKERLENKELIDLITYLNELEDEKIKIQKKMKIVYNDVIDKATDLGLLVGYLACGNHDNPYKVCMYDEDDGPHDNCLYCHEPEDRR